MTFPQAIQHCLTHYADFNGRASRAEFWWFFLFSCLVGLICGAISDVLGAVVQLGLLLPQLAVGVRRLHDTDKSGWLQLLLLLPVLGFFILVFFWAQAGEPAANTYGDAIQH